MTLWEGWNGWEWMGGDGNGWEGMETDYWMRQDWAHLLLLCVALIDILWLDSRTLIV